ncbi:MAG: DUF4292 domain-containing protein [Bacteroidota bacterium]|nr:DUF4292 domain-containing protein [Bacteroidota bacterium]MDP4216828.1 DUF4292 domain-containing protein [Bacteroidota bacterium]MDP4256088.1 DUF4292 domain-containing protein [Bacteroidota bacterium]
MNKMIKMAGGMLFVVIGMAVSCRSTKSIRRAMAVQHKDSAAIVVLPATDSARLQSKEDLRNDSMRVMHTALEGLDSNRINFSTFSAKVRVNYEGGEGNGSDFTAYIHIKKDSLIWVSVSALLGIEAFRMLITPDSVIILDKLKKIVRIRRVNYLQQEIHMPVDFKALQDLLIGNPMYLDTGNVLFYKREQAGLSIMTIDSLFKNYTTLNATDHTLRHSKLDDTDPMRARSCDLTYGDYDLRDGMRFSTYRKISVAEKSKLDIELSFKQYNFNTPLSFTFSIPKNYKRK